MQGRHALVIGANSYFGQDLDNAIADAHRIADALRQRAFSVSTVLDPDAAAIDTVLNAFRSIAQKAEIALVYLAGHAVERHGSGYFLPIDFKFPPTAADLRYTAVPFNAFVEATNGAAARIIIADVCRNWPVDPDQARRTSNDLDELIAAERDWPNLLLAYATSATTRAGDGARGAGSTFSNSLRRHLLDHGLTMDECFRRVSQDVVATRREQHPWTYSSLAYTLSFTDLPRFAAIQRHAIPNPEHLSVGAWTTTTSDDRGVIVGLGDTRAWRADLGGFKKASYSGDDRLVGAADCGSALVLAGAEGALYCAGAIERAALTLDVDPSFGLTASPSRSGFIHHGAGAVTCLRIGEDAIEVVSRHDVGFDVYCCAFMPDGMVWVAGGLGEIYEIDPTRSDPPFRVITVLRHPINAMEIATTGDRIFVVGQGGLAVELDRSGAVIADLLPGRQLKTAAGIRAQLVDSADDETIRAYIFQPSKLTACVRKELAELVGVPNYLHCALAPSLPMLAIATQESSVVLLDTRDLQIVQEFDVGSGNSSIVAGVHFLSDHELAVVGGRGEITIFAA